MIETLNKASSQIWSAFLILCGLAAFGIACVCHPADVRAALMSSGTGMIRHSRLTGLLRQTSWDRFVRRQRWAI